MPFNIVIRADASDLIGSGHVMRCLTLALQLKSAGMRCRFVCRDHIGNLGQRIEQAGFAVSYLPVSADFPETDWLGAPPHEDVAQTLDALGEFVPDWLILDHYGIDEEWERGFREKKPETRILVIDDLADRSHLCDCLVDLSPGREEQDYAGLVGPETELCLGLSFALLRPEFLKKRQEIGGPRTATKTPPHLLISFGGGDTTAHLAETGKALAMLSETLEFTASVIGASDAAKSYFTSPVKHHAHSNDMATEIAASDLMICAAGGTNWERYCLGVPGIVMKIAENQSFNAAAIGQAGGGLLVESKADEIRKAAQTLLSDEEAYQRMSARCWKLCDGKGAKRISRALVGPFLNIVKCTRDDARFVYDARYGDGAERYYKTSVKPSYSDHVDWYEKALNSDAYALFCVELGSEKIAHVRLDPNPEEASHAEIGIALHASVRDFGWGAPVLRSACTLCRDLGFTKVNAEIHRDNVASMKVFEMCGFVRLGEKDDVLVLLELDLG